MYAFYVREMDNELTCTFWCHDMMLHSPCDNVLTVFKITELDVTLCYRLKKGCCLVLVLAKTTIRTKVWAVKHFSAWTELCNAVVIYWPLSDGKATKILSMKM